MDRRAPRPASLALRAVLQRSAPQTDLAAAQTVWPEAVGEAIAEAAEPVSEHAGVLTIRCRSATWAQELALMEGELLKRLGERLGDRRPKALRFLAG
jgi:predicted nucleic acid-binding Zn ribbon protein